MLSAYITPKVNMEKYSYSATIRFTSEDPFTYSKVVVGRSYRSITKFEKIVLDDYTDDILFGPSRTEESFDLDLFSFKERKNRDFRLLFMIQTNTSGVFADLENKHFYHADGGLFKTVNGQSIAINNINDYYSMFGPELLEEILTKLWDYDQSLVRNILITSDVKYIITSTGEVIKIVDYAGNTNIIHYTAEEFEEMVASIHGSFNVPYILTTDGKAFFTSEGLIFSIQV